MQKQRQTGGKGLDVWGDAWKDKKQAKRKMLHTPFLAETLANS